MAAPGVPRPTNVRCSATALVPMNLLMPTAEPAAFTRRHAIARGSLVVIAAAPVLRAMQPEVAPAATDSGRWAFGAFAGPTHGNADAMEAVRRLEALVEGRVEIVSSFLAWDEPFPNPDHRAVRDAGRRPLIAWYTDGDLAAVSAGRADKLLLARARACRDFAAPIYLRWAAEFNDASNACYGRPAEFIAAWRRIVTVFRGAGATNVRWVWCPLALEQAWSPADDWRRYHPGDRFVDWVGMDGFNWGTTRSWSKWQSFRDIFGPMYSQYSRRKPIMICEVASAPAGGNKAKWIKNMGSSLAGPFSRIKAVVWFHADKENDWRINSSGSTVAAFRSILHARQTS